MKRLFKTIQFKIALYFLLTCWLLIGLVGTVFYMSTAGKIKENQLAYTRGTVEQGGVYIEVFLERLKGLSTLLSTDESLIAYLTDGDDEMKQKAYGLVERYLASDEALSAVTVVGKNGAVLSTNSDMAMSLSDDMMKEQWYVDALASDMPVLTSARRQQLTMDKSNWVISISTEIDDSVGNNLGVLLMDIPYDVLENYLGQMNLGASGYAYILNDAKKVVYHPDTRYFEDEDNRQALVSLYDMGSCFHEDSQQFIHLTPIAHSDWTLVGVSSLDNLFAMRRHLYEILLLAGLIGALMMVGVAYYVSRVISDPIKKLERAMSQFEATMAPIVTEEGWSTEVLTLSAQYNKMIETIKGLMATIKENESYLRQYEINALHSQINPHFLYNTLDTIVWMASFGDSEKVIAVTKSLAQFFRISLSQGEQTISLEDELEHVRQYLFIQKQRYEDTLNDRYEIDETALSVKVPKIILQPVVENAIYHGIKEKDGAGTIAIRVTDETEFVLIIIEDDGVGFNPAETPQKGCQLGGVGLYNVDRRLKLYYGDAYGLEIDSAPKNGTRVTFKIPKTVLNT